MDRSDRTNRANAVHLANTDLLEACAGPRNELRSVCGDDDYGVGDPIDRTAEAVVGEIGSNGRSAVRTKTSRERWDPAVW